MRKLRLHPDELAVETFQLVPADEGRGTVAANVDDAARTASCPNPCQYSCAGTCAPVCPSGYPDPCWISWDPAGRCAIPTSDTGTGTAA